MIVLAIDTDSRGAMAMLDTRRLMLDVFATPTEKIKMASGKSQLQMNLPVLAAILHDLTSHADVAWLEKQWARPNQGVTSTFGFGKTYGEYRGIVTFGFLEKECSPLPQLQERVHLVSGAEWKGKMRLTKDKKEARALATQLFPECASAWKSKDSSAEASLLAFYGASMLGEKIPFGAKIKPSIVRYTAHAESLIKR